MKYILGAYSQLPYGCSKEEYDVLIDSMLKPLLTMVYRNNNLKLLFRLSIAVFDYLQSHKPEVNMLINDLCRRGQMEILTSTYYDVLLSMSKTHEKSSQIEKTTTYIRKHFSKRPRGLWCYNQVFNPAMVPIIAQTGLQYIVVSTYNQITNTVEATKPFYTDELGSQALVFPVDDRYSKETLELYKNNIDTEHYLANMERLAKETTSSISTIMLNLDQMMSTKNSVDVFSLLYEKLGPNCTLPSLYIQENNIIKTHYLPNGLYGRDFSIGKATSVNQLIYESPMLSRYYCVLNMLKDVIRDNKKSIEDKKSIENLLMKASSSSIYFPTEYRRPPVIRAVNRHLSEIETLLFKMNNCSIPEKVDINFDRSDDYRIQNKQHIAYLRTKGAQISRFIITSNLWDLALHNADGIFTDNFINAFTLKELKLNSKQFEVTELDKKRLDFFAKSPSFLLGKSQVSLTKRFKFRPSTVIVEIEIENLSNERIDGFIYENIINLALPVRCNISTPEGSIHDTEFVDTQNLLISDKNCPFTISLQLSENNRVERNDFDQKCSTWLGERTFYEYTQLKIQKKLNLSPMEDSKLTISLRTDKRKEKHNDTNEQSAP